MKLPGLFFIAAVAVTAFGSAHALSDAGKKAVDGAARALVIDEKCTGSKSVEQARADAEKAMAVIVADGHDVNEVMQAWAAYAMRADLAVQHPTRKQCADAAEIVRATRAFKS